MSQFETQICSRCHGSGEYSYCAYYGKRCFKCGGKKTVFTARGRAAYDYFVKLCSKNVSDLKIGDKIKTSGMTSGHSFFDYIAVVTEIKPGNSDYRSVNGEAADRIQITTESPKYGKSGLNTFANATVVVYSEENKNKLTEALEYQKTLTKAGKARKRKVV